MATANLGLARWNDDSGMVDVTYDTASLVCQTLVYQNLNPKPAAVTATVTGVGTQTWTIPQNTLAGTTTNIASNNITLTTVVNKAGHTVVTLPSTVSISVRYPA